MADYIYINKSERGGELAISRKVFSSLVSEAVGHTSLKSSIKIKEQPKVVFKKDGKVIISLKVSVKKGVKPTEACVELQKEVAHALEVYVESIPFEVEVSVDEIR